MNFGMIKGKLIGQSGNKSSDIISVDGNAGEKEAGCESPDRCKHLSDGLGYRGLSTASWAMRPQKRMIGIRVEDPICYHVQYRVTGEGMASWRIGTRQRIVECVLGNITLEELKS